MTLELVILSQLIAVFVGVPAGIVMALKRDTWTDYVVRIVSLAGLSLPSFWSATLFLVGGRISLTGTRRWGTCLSSIIPWKT